MVFKRQGEVFLAFDEKYIKDISFRFQASVETAFLQNKKVDSILKDFHEEWCLYLHGITAVQLDSFPVIVTLSSSLRDFFRFDAIFIQDINRGKIFLRIKSGNEWDCIVHTLRQSLFENLKLSLQSSFLSLCSEFSPRIFSKEKYKEILDSPLFFSWQRKRYHLIPQTIKLRIFRNRMRHVLTVLGIIPPVRVSRPLVISVLVTCASIFILNFSGYSRTAVPFEKIQISSDSRASVPDEFIHPESLKINGDPEERLGIFQSLGTIVQIQSLPYDSGHLQGIFWPEKEFSDSLSVTFDDGPNFSQIVYQERTVCVTEAILDVLQERGVQAVFFINGKNLSSETGVSEFYMRKVFTRMIREGHIIGNHSYHHYNLANGKFSDGINDYQEIKEEFTLTQESLETILGYHYPLLMVRPPYAEPGRTHTLDKVLMDSKTYYISLQFDSYDYAYTPEGYWQLDKLEEHITDLIEPSQGGVILMHDRPQTVSLLKSLLNNSDINGKRAFTPLAELLFKRYQP